MPDPAIFNSSTSVCLCFRVSVYDNGTLRIAQVKPRNTGRYTCVVRYGGDKQVQEEATLHIAGKS